MKRMFWLVAAFEACSLIAPCANGQEATGVYGAWDLTLQTEGGPRPSWVRVFTDGDAVAAEFVGTGGGKNRAEAVKVEEDRVEWTIERATYQAKLSDGKLTGNLVRGDRRTAFTGERVIRQVDLSGTWDVELDVGDRQMQRVLKLEQHGDEITGRYGGGPIAERELATVTWEHGRLTFAIEFTNDDRDFTVDYDVNVRGDVFTGTVAVRGTDWRGTVKAIRQRTWNDPIELIGSERFVELGFSTGRWARTSGKLSMAYWSTRAADGTSLAKQKSQRLQAPDRRESPSRWQQWHLYQRSLRSPGGR